MVDGGTSRRVVTAADVDLAAGLVVLGKHKTVARTGQMRLVALVPDAVDILRRRIETRPGGLLFPGQKGQQLSANSVSCRMRRLCLRAGVKATCYGHRHTYATDALLAGVPDATVAALLGHSGTAMLHKHYAHLTAHAQALRDAAAKVR